MNLLWMEYEAETSGETDKNNSVVLIKRVSRCF